MYIVQPAAELFAEFDEHLNKAVLDQLMGEMQLTDVELYLPKFQFSGEANVKRALQHLGLNRAWSVSTADFSKIYERAESKLYLHGAYHKAYIAVNEEGTEASAATGIVAGIVSLPKQMYVNTPFVYLIRHKQSGTILFMGRVTDPSD